MLAENIEIMAPAGSFEALLTAIHAGAQSVYFGVGNLNMRSRAANFKTEDLTKIAEICNKHNVKSYLTLNTVIYNEDIEPLKQLCDQAKKANITAIIASDFAVINYAKSIGLEIHLSTQCNVSNIEAVKFYSQFADVIVLARELKLDQIKHICDEIKKQNIFGPSGKQVQIEIFIHGALCVAISGKCYMSLAQYNTSANRGQCLQACRRSYKVIDEETGDELKVKNKFIMSPKDLSTIEVLDKILNSGVSILKIEGRGRSPEYVDKVVKIYSKAIDDIKSKNFTKEKALEYKKEVEKVFNRGFWEGGYYLGEKTGEWSGLYGSKATEKKKTIGIIQNYYNKNNIAELLIQTGEINIDDELLIIGPTTGLVRFKIEEMRVNEKESKTATKGNEVTIPLDVKVRKNDAVYKIEKIEN